jgi:hypothetical protein
MMEATSRGLGVVQVIRVERGRWIWIRRNQAGEVVARSSNPVPSRWRAEREARRANGRALPVLRVVQEPLRRV